MAELFAFTYEEKKQMAARTAQLLKEEIGLKGDAIQAVYLIPEIDEGHMTIEQVEEQYGPQVARILHGLNRIQQLYQKNPVIEASSSCIRRIPLLKARTSVTCCFHSLKICG